ncbi:Calx-beta domain-containing protein, partial [Microcystis aeruginosa]|uniref:Calx-beta domain-containing protein n=1 Tax=Microcystis aeruginosa TaxID=1126 RepID=UPI0035B53A25
LVRVQTTDDSISESSESYTLTATANSVSASGTATITDNDAAPVVTSVTGNTIVEGGFNTFTVNLDHASSTATSTTLALSSGTATVGTDTDSTPAGLQYSTDGGTTWTNYAGSVSVPAGSTSFLVRVQTTDDSISESSESYTLTATANSVSASGTATITDNDAAP